MIFRFLKTWARKQAFIITLSARDFKSKYAGNTLGILWAIIQPVVMILIFWFVFQVGFKSQPIDNFPFILWLATAMIGWNFFVDSIQGGSNSIVDNAYLVKKMVFNVNILPAMKMYSALFIHAFFLLFLVIMFLIYGYTPNVYMLQVFYYAAGTFVLALGLSWLTSSLIVFIKDIRQLVNMGLQIGFWLTPIFYALTFVPESYRVWLRLNPLYYITNGYREAFIEQIWFWEHPAQMAQFWITAVCCLLIGAIVFRRLKPHFADVL